MHTPHRRWSRVAALLALGCGLGAVVSPARAQLPSASARALGLGDNYAALARGYAAVAWNPANLGMPGNPSFSIALLPLRGTAGLDPITLSDLKEFEGDTVPFARREQWLAEITAEGNESGRSGAEVTYLALSAGRFGFQISTALRTTADIGPDAAELILFGNAGRTGQPQNLDLAGSRFDLVATSSAAVSYAHPLALELGPLPDQHFAVGATLKYVMGHVLASGQDEGSTLTSTPELDISFPVIETGVEDGGGNAGSGWGLDVGAAWQGGMFGASLAIHNLVNTFEWDEDQLVMRPGEVLFTQDTSFTDFETTLPLDDPSVPQPVRDRAEELLDHFKYKPVLALGASVRPLPYLTIAGDLRQQLGDGLELGGKTHAGAGAELRIIPFLPIRAGAALVSLSGAAGGESATGLQLSAGIGLEVGPLNLGVSAARRDTDLGTDTMAMFALSFGAR